MKSGSRSMRKFSCPSRKLGPTLIPRNRNAQPIRRKAPANVQACRDASSVAMAAPPSRRLRALLESFHDIPFLSRPTGKALERGDVPLEDTPRRDASEDLIELFVGCGLRDEDKRPIPNRESPG